MYGFIICQPYADQIINGTKQYEYRNWKTNILGKPVYLLSGGFAIGIIQFESIEEAKNSKYRYAWKVKVIEKFDTPRKYLHLKGAVKWIKDVQFLD